LTSGVITGMHDGALAPTGIMWQVQRYALAPAAAELYTY